MAHFAKFTKGATGHMFEHYDRSKNNLPDNIKPELTHLNYNLADEFQPLPQDEFLRKRLGEVRCQRRADVNVMCDWVITKPQDVPENETKKFFQLTFDYLCYRYGEKNVISAYVHMDETTPHLHFSFIPVVPDKKRDGYKVSAKECVTRHDLQLFHADLQGYLESNLDHEVGILNGKTVEGIRSVQELKRLGAIERLKNASESASKIVSKAKDAARAVQLDTEAVRAEYEEKKAYINACDEASKVSVMYPPEVHVITKGVLNKQTFVEVPDEMWRQRHVSANEKDVLKKTTDVFDQMAHDLRSEVDVHALNRQIAELKEENSKLAEQNRKLYSAWDNSKSDLQKHKDHLNEVLERLPPETAKRFIDEWNRKERRWWFEK